MKTRKIRHVLDRQVDLELAVLIGSRANGSVHAESDWDIAIQWKRELSLLENLANTETLRHDLAVALDVDDHKIDLIDLPRAGLAMRAVVAEEGVALKGGNSLSWNHFLGRVWRELEDYEWEKQHAA